LENRKSKIENREEEDLTQRAQRESAEVTEKEKRAELNAETLRARRRTEEKRIVALVRKSPPLQTKGGAPSSSIGRQHNEEHNQEWLCHMR
jgi:hypothetical protein